MIEAALVIYTTVGIVAAVDAGSDCRDEVDHVPWWADAIAFASMVALWLPIVASVVIAHARRRQ